MHMADALVSSAVGGTMWAATAGLIAYSARKLKQGANDRLIPLMGVTGAFVFAAQMINFGIPGTGSSGHIGGGLLLAALLGPHAAFLVVASILTVQALFFADGGLLALGCNIFNLGVFPCFIVFPLMFRPLLKNGVSVGRLFGASVAGAVIALELGAFGVVLQTTVSGITELPFGKFILLMLPVHLVIGVVEGLATASVLGFVWKARPELLGPVKPQESVSVKRVAIGLLAGALITGGLISWFASGDPDGLEWSIEKTKGSPDLEAHGSIHDTMTRIQEKTAILPDYNFPEHEPESELAEANGEHRPAIRGGTTVAGIAGSLAVLLVAAGTGFLLRPGKDGSAES